MGSVQSGRRGFAVVRAREVGKEICTSSGNLTTMYVRKSMNKPEKKRRDFDTGEKCYTIKAVVTKPLSVF